MGYPKHALLAFGGPMGDAGQESWSCTMKLWNPTWESQNSDALQLYLKNQLPRYKETIQGFMNACGVVWNHAAGLSWVKANAIGPDGLYISGETNVIEGAVFRNDDLQVYPFQLACVVSMSATGARGIGSRARFYIPAGVTVNGDGFMSQGACTQVLLAAKSLINGIGNEPGPDTNGAAMVSCVSRGKQLGPKQWGPGIARPVTLVSVDNVLDTQRRRREQLVATRYSEALTQV